MESRVPSKARLKSKFGVLNVDFNSIKQVLYVALDKRLELFYGAHGKITISPMQIEDYLHFAQMYSAYHRSM